MTLRSRSDARREKTTTSSASSAGSRRGTTRVASPILQQETASSFQRSKKYDELVLSTSMPLLQAVRRTQPGESRHGAAQYRRQHVNCDHKLDTPDDPCQRRSPDTR